MAVPNEIRARLSDWCAARVPEGERDHRQISYTTQGDEVSVLDRRAPTYPELDAAWSATPLAVLRLNDPDDGSWSLYLPTGDDGGWRRDEPPGDDPIALLERLLA
jgi:hypothetical protein